jgi:hypothetical protein
VPPFPMRFLSLIVLCAGSLFFLMLSLKKNALVPTGAPLPLPADHVDLRKDLGITPIAGSMLDESPGQRAEDLQK